jgi:DNA-binding GntR family transcriptional regulator
MPLCKCHYCGKKVPNPYRPYHEQVCIVRRQKEGTYVSPESKKRHEKARLKRLEQEEIERKNRPQKNLERFIVEAKT